MVIETRHAYLSAPRYLNEGPHGEEVGQHGGQALGQAALGDEAGLQLRQADGVVALPPVPAGNVQQMGLRNATRTERRSQDAVVTGVGHVGKAFDALGFVFCVIFLH